LPNYTFTIDQYELARLPIFNIQVMQSIMQVIRGVYVFNTGSGYNAFEAACPNQALSACSTMTLGINVVCSCDNNEYSLFTGLSQGGSQYHKTISRGG
jgi:nitrite reductase/ring-hydroxylating ferredoxin subunit